MQRPSDGRDSQLSWEPCLQRADLPRPCPAPRGGQHPTAGQREGLTAWPPRPRGDPSPSHPPTPRLQSSTWGQPLPSRGAHCSPGLRLQTGVLPSFPQARLPACPSCPSLRPPDGSRRAPLPEDSPGNRPGPGSSPPRERARIPYLSCTGWGFCTPIQEEAPPNRTAHGDPPVRPPPLNAGIRLTARPRPQSLGQTGRAATHQTWGCRAPAGCWRAWGCC